MEHRVDEDEPIYGIVASGPEVSAAEVETAEPVLEVVVCWGERSILHVAYLSRGRAFTVGEDQRGGEETAFPVPAEVLGATRLELARFADDGRFEVASPEGGHGELLDRGTSFPLMPGVHALPEGATARLSVGSFVFVVRGVRAGRRVAAGHGFDRRPWAYFGATLLVTALVLGLFHLVPPRSAALSIQDVDAASRLVDFAIEASSAARTPAPTVAEEGGGASGEAAGGPAGRAGEARVPRTDHRGAVRGPRDSRATQLARDPRESIQRSTVIEVLRATAFGGAATSVFGADHAIGSDAVSALGALLGARPGEDYGQGGLGLRGAGRGGLGDGRLGTFALGRFGTHTGAEVGDGDAGGAGRGDQGLHGRTGRGPRIVPQPARVDNPGLSADAVRRVVRRHLNEVRFCYEQGLQRRADLEGRVVTRFIIGPSGSVGAATATGDSTLSDPAVQSCVAGAVRRWAFPAPNNGQIVTVTYPFSFASR